MSVGAAPGTSGGARSTSISRIGNFCLTLDESALYGPSMATTPGATDPPLEHGGPVRAAAVRVGILGTGSMARVHVRRPGLGRVGRSLDGGGHR